MKSNKGFSLVELIVVIAIMAIIAAVAIPVYSTYVTKAETATAQQAVDDAEYAIALALVEFDAEVTSSTNESSKTVTYTFSGNDAADAADQVAKIVGVTASNNAVTITLKTMENVKVSYAASATTSTQNP